jgi:hypothetical protein
MLSVSGASIKPHEIGDYEFTTRIQPDFVTIVPVSPLFPFFFVFNYRATVISKIVDLITVYI